jgi:hypothetical protein
MLSLRRSLASSTMPPVVTPDVVDALTETPLNERPAH